jgi:hypothetical protein
VSAVRATPASRSASTRSRAAQRRRSQRDSQAVLIACLTLLATGLAFYDLIVLTAGLKG